MKTQSHQLDILHTTGSKYKYKCKLCQQEWITFPTSTCPGVNVFTSRGPTVCPERYKTLAELEAKDLRPKRVDQPIAAFRPSHRGAWDFLYDETEALPKRRSEATVRILKGGFRLFAWLVNVVVASLIAVLLGLNPAPSSPTNVPVMNFVLRHQLLSLIIVCGVVLLTLLGLLLFSPHYWTRKSPATRRLWLDHPGSRSHRPADCPYASPT